MSNALKVGVLVWMSLMSACTTVKDLDAPCTDFGRYCHQEPINVVGNPSR